MSLPALVAFPIARHLDDLGPAIDLLLVTATEVERDAVLRRLRPLPGREACLHGAVGKSTYSLGMLGAHGAALVMCRMGALGGGAARDAVAEGCATWAPRAVVMVGIAFGKDPTKQRLGDVLVSTQIISYEEQRLGDRPHFRGPIVEAHRALVDRFRNVVGWSFPREDGTACSARWGVSARASCRGPARDPCR
jgi:nucleoside phosphorylase